MKPRLDWANVKLTKEQQKLVANYEKYIGFVCGKLYHMKKGEELEEYCYGMGALYLCHAAVLYTPACGVFSGYAWQYIKYGVLNARRKFFKHRDRCKLSLDTPILSEDGSDTFTSLIPAPDEIEPLEYRILTESVYQKVEPALIYKGKGKKQAEVFRLWLHGMREPEIAKRMKISDAYVRELICYSKKICRTYFNADEIFS
ncbi:MAG TPA: hypothetical protein DHW78_10110 [Ruminococcaceae bacterium]|jgi:hypothetical protein|nr:hypothetical protein [Oscillospiraceae bacterium]